MGKVASIKIELLLKVQLDNFAVLARVMLYERKGNFQRASAKAVCVVQDWEAARTTDST